MISLASAVLCRPAAQPGRYNHRLHNPASLGNHQAASHLVGDQAWMRKIFLFGAGLSGVSPCSPDACSARPGLLQTSDNLDSAILTESTPRGTPNGNILHIWAEKTTTCRRGTRKGTPEPKNAAPRTQACTPKPRSADPYGRPPTRVEQNCHALDKSIRPQAKDGPIQAES